MNEEYKKCEKCNGDLLFIEDLNILPQDDGGDPEFTVSGPGHRCKKCEIIYFDGGTMFIFDAVSMERISSKAAASQFKVMKDYYG